MTYHNFVDKTLMCAPIETGSILGEALVFKVTALLFSNFRSLIRHNYSLVRTGATPYSYNFGP